MRRLLSILRGWSSNSKPGRARTARRTPLQVEQFEDRLAPAAGLREQYMLELINHMRENPAAALTRLLNANDVDVTNALNHFNVDSNVLAQQWSTLTPAAPLAWNDDIAAADLAHSQAMLDWDQQSHQLPGESATSQRMTNAGWDTTNAFWQTAENIYAFAESVFHAHAALAIDWGAGPNGIQSPPDHRNNLMNAKFQEIGIGLVDATAGKQTGPLLVTQDFGYRSTVAPHLLGVVYKDLNKDGFYSMGEGLSGVTLNVSGLGGSFSVVTSAAGGYQLQVPAGDYTVTASGGGLSAALSSNVTIGTANVRLAFVAPAGPAAPTITGPISVAAGVLPTFTWKASTGAVRYELWVDNLTTGQREVIHRTNVTTTSFKSTTALPAGYYRAWVKAFDSAGQGSNWSVALNFAVGAPATPKMTGPTSATTATAPRFTWTASAGASRYELWVDNLTTGQREIIHPANLTTTSYIHAAGLGVGTYRVWVKAYNKADLANNWSLPLTFTVRYAAPVAPKLTAPTGATTLAPPQFAWTASLGAVRYELWVNNLTTRQQKVIYQTNLTSTSFTPLDALTAGSYRAWVRAFNAVGQVSAWSAYRSFIVTGVAPSAPTVTGPTGGTSATPPTFTWTVPQGAVRFDLWVDNLSTGVRQIVRQTSLTTTSVTPQDALAAGVYRVWVRAFDSSGKISPWSASLDFTITSADLAAPVITSPFGDTTGQPTIIWNAVAGAVRYDLWVNNLTTGQAQVIRQMNLTETSYQPATPLAEGSYRAWVQAWSADGAFSAWSAPADFTVVSVDLGQKVVEFAQGKLGQQVGGGECTHLVEAALQAAGAKTTFDFGVSGLDADYVWGDLVATYRAGDNAAILASIRPGDIIQYRNVELREDFSWASFPHHTSIVKENLGNGKFTILEQNVNGERWVHETTQNLAAMTAGVVWIYRPVQK